MKKGEKNLGAAMDEKLVSLFSEQCDERSFKSKKAMAAAVRLWVSLPFDIQSKLQGKGILRGGLEGVLNTLISQLVLAFRNDLTENQRQTFDDEAKQTKQKLDRKK